MRRLLLAAALAATLPLPRPLAAQGKDVTVKLSGLAQVQFNTTSIDDDAAGAADAQLAGSTFETRRVRLAAAVAIREWITGLMEYDLALGRARVTDAWLDLALADEARLRIGQFKKPFGVFELTSSSQVLPIERGVAIRGLPEALQSGMPGESPQFPPRAAGAVLLGEEYQMISALGYAGRDIGAMLHGKAGRFTYAAGIFNGSGADRRDTNDGKSFAARATVAPLAGHPFAVGAGVSRRETFFEGAIDDVSFSGDVEGTLFEVDAEWGAFRRPGLRVQLEGVAGDNLLPGGELRGAQGVVAWFHPLEGLRVEGVEPLFRASYGDPRTDGEADEAWLVTPGFNLYFFGRNRLMLNWDFYLPSRESQETAHALRAQAQLHF